MAACKSFVPEIIKEQSSILYPARLIIEDGAAKHRPMLGFL
jgi:hypothetical protein